MGQLMDSHQARVSRWTTRARNHVLYRLPGPIAAAFGARAARRGDLFMEAEVLSQ